jgi:hypothetical protein
MVLVEPGEGGVEGELGEVVWALAMPAAARSVARVTIVRVMVGPSLSVMDIR